MAGDDVTQRAHRNGVFAGRAGSQRLLRRQGVKEQDAGAADMLEFRDQVVPGAVVKVSRRDVGILLEAGQGSMVVACESERPVSEDSFGVGQMPDDFLDAPFPGA